MFPKISDIPEELESLSGNCGPVSVWMILTKMGIEVCPLDIIKKCRYTPEYGSFAICMANALHDYGLNIEFYTDEDSDQKAIEKEGYKQAIDKFTINKALSLSKLVKKIAQGENCIVSYNALGGDGHFSPVEKLMNNKLILPYSMDGLMLKSEFQYRWRAPEILRQCIFAT